jgi:peptidoglycan-associated lipoprotein
MRSPSPHPAKTEILVLCACAVIFSACAGSRIPVREHPAPERAADAVAAPGVPIPATRSETTPPRPTPAPQSPDAQPPEERPVNPASWGEPSRIGVDRRFEPIHFDSWSAELDLIAQQRLQRDAEWLRRNPRVWLVVAGHCERDATSGYAYHIAMARALAVRDFLDRQGIPTGRLYEISFGLDQPAVPGDSLDANALNNRVELIGFISPEGVETPQALPDVRIAAPPVAEPSPAPRAQDLY